MKKLLLLIVIIISGCDYIDNKKQKDELVLKNIKAIGSGCRQSGKGLEDCFQLYENNSKSAILEGWKEMDIYMRENNLKIQKTEIKN